MKKSDLNKIFDKLKWKVTDVQIEALLDRLDTKETNSYYDIISQISLNFNKKPASLLEVEKYFITGNNVQKLNCNKCKFGMIYVYNEECNNIGKNLPYMSNCKVVSCTCSKSAQYNIHKYLEKLARTKQDNPELYEFQIIALYMFVRDDLGINIRFKNFNPYNFWGLQQTYFIPKISEEHLYLIA